MLKSSKTKDVELLILFLLVLVIVLTIVFIPSINMPELIHSTQTGKFIVFGYCILAMQGLWCIHLILTRYSSFSINILDLGLVLLLSYVVINRYWIHSVYGFSMKFYELVAVFLFYVFLRNLPRYLFKYLFLAVILGGTLQAIYGILQLWGYYPSHHSGFKMTGSFFNPGPYTGYLICVFPVALGCYLYRDRMDKVMFSNKYLPWFKLKFLGSEIAGLLNVLIFDYLLLVGVFSILLVLPASQSRAAWLAVIISSGFLFWIRYDFYLKIQGYFDSLLKKMIVLVLFIGVVIFGASGLYSFKKDSADGRLLIWEVTSKVIIDYPILGIGYDRFGAHYMNYQAEYFLEHGEHGEEMVAGESGYAFNELLLFISEQGIIGLVILLLIVALIVKTIINTRDDFLVVIATGGMVSALIFSCFSYASEILPIKICIALYLVIIGNKITWDFRVQSLSFLLKGILFFSMGTFLFFGYTRVATLQRGFKDWKEAYATYQFGLYEDSTEEYEEIMPVFGTYGQFLMNYGKALSMAENHDKAIEVLSKANNYISSTVLSTALGNSYQAQKQYLPAEKSYQKAWNMIPSRFYPKYLLAKMHLESGKTKEAIDIANELLNKEVKIESRAIKEIKEEMKQIIQKSGQDYL